MARWLIPSLADVVFVALVGFVLGFRTHQLFNADGDLARHLAVGRQILADGAVPFVDLFSHTRGGEPFVPYEWLSELLFALAYRHMGLEGVAVLSVTLVALPFLLLTRWMMRDGANPFVVLFVVTVGALTSSMHWLARPHLFTTLLAQLWARALTRHRESGSLRYLVALPPLMALWTNLHGGFLVGFVLLGIFLLAALIPRQPAVALKWGDLTPQQPALGARRSVLALAATGVASLIAVGANPAGYAVLPHVLSYFQYRFLVDNTVEYLSPNFHDAGPQLFLVLALLAMVSMAMIPRRIDLADLGMLVVWISFSLYSTRNIPLFVVTCLPAVARLATESLSTLVQGSTSGASRPSLARRLAATDRLLGRPLLPALAVALALLASTGALAETQPRAAFDPSVFPVEALARAEEVGVQGNMFNYFIWGGYILHAAYPRHRVFIDGQTDFYGEQLTRDYLQVTRLAPDWEEVLDRYQVGWVLFPSASALSQILARSPGWKLAHHDSTASIFVRSPPGGR